MITKYAVTDLAPIVSTGDGSQVSVRLLTCAVPWNKHVAHRRARFHLD